MGKVELIEIMRKRYPIEMEGSARRGFILGVVLCLLVNSNPGWAFQPGKEESGDTEELTVRRFGLQENERQEFYSEFGKLDREAEKEAAVKYPDDMFKRYDYKEKLYYKHERALLKKYGLSEDEAKRIISEGIAENW